MSEISFIDYNPKQIETDLINLFEQTTGEVLYPGDERRIFLSNQIPIIVAMYSSINDVGKQNLLRYARGNVLDAIGERTDTIRIPAQKAKVTIRFTLSAASSSSIVVPAGKRVTPDGLLYFVTLNDSVIPAGQTYIDVKAESAEEGASYNGFVAGQINKIVDPIPYVSTAVNIDTSTGGADIETDDDGINAWSGYRERIRQSPSKFSTAGPADAYIYWAKSANQAIVDIAVTSPSAGQVKITVLMDGGQLPSQGILDEVLAVCSDRKRRPLTDHVIVAAPAPTTYSIDLTYYISQERATEETQIRNAIEGIGGALEQYNIWQKAKLGRAINPDHLRQLMLNAGACRISVLEPSFLAINEDAVATPGALTLNYGGLI